MLKNNNLIYNLLSAFFDYYILFIYFLIENRGCLAQPIQDNLQILLHIKFSRAF